MREAMIVVPKADNEGRSLRGVLDATTRRLALAFGGATVSEGQGLWIAPDGTLFDEPVWRVETATVPGPNTDAILRGIAYQVGRDGRQQAVYVRFPSGDVEVLDTLDAAEDAEKEEAIAA